MSHSICNKSLVSIVAFSAALAACATEQEPPVDPRAQILVDAAWLAEHVTDPNLVLLHVGDSADYAEEHIPGAHHVTLPDVSAPRSDDPDALTLQLPEPAALESFLEGLGVSDESRIVVYWGSEWITPATRVVLTMDWAGLGDRTVLLDGGIEAWKRSGQTVTDEVPTAPVGSLTLHPRPELIVDAEFVAQQATQHGYSLLDARSHEYYSGESEGRVKTGHIPGAGNADWRNMVDDSLLFESPEEIAGVFSAAGVEPGDTVVVYCHIGQYATATIFAARTLGYEVRLYDGSFQDWAARDLPVETTNEDNPT